MSSARRYFGTDGIRGRVGEGAISADFVLRLGNALGRVLAAGQPVRRTVVIGKDTRISGYMFESALEAGLVADWRRSLWWPDGELSVQAGPDRFVGRLADVTEAGALVLDTDQGPRILETGRLRPSTSGPYNAPEGGSRHVR